MNSLFPESEHPTSVQLGDRIIKKFVVDYNGESIETIVEIKVSYCKKEERERYGSRAGGEPFGKKYLFRNLIGTSGYHNISIVRAGREIDHGSFGFIRDVSDNRERWWSAEICIEPVIDSIAGVDNKKQQASNIHFLEPSDSEYNDNHEIIRWISTFLSENVKRAKDIINSQNATGDSTNSSSRKAKGVKLPPGGDTEAGDPVTSDLEPGSEEDKLVRREFFEWIKTRYPDLAVLEIEDIVAYALGMKDSHIFIKSDLGDTQLYSYKVFGTKVLIEINFNHSFYNRFMSNFEYETDNNKALRSIRLMISAMVNSEIVNTTSDKDLINDRKRIRNRMFESLDGYIEDLYSR
jgi:hypothetical protein